MNHRPPRQPLPFGRSASSSSSPSSRSSSSSSSPAPPTASTSKPFATSLSDFALPSGPAHVQHATASTSPISIPSKPAPKKAAASSHSLVGSPSKLSSQLCAGPESASPTVGLGFTTTSGPSSSARAASLATASPTSSAIFLRRSAATAAATAAAAAAASTYTSGGCGESERGETSPTSVQASSPASVQGQASPASGSRANSSRLRRSSMLGREITPFELDDDEQQSYNYVADQSPSRAPASGSSVAVDRQVGFEPVRTDTRSTLIDPTLSTSTLLVGDPNAAQASTAASVRDEDVQMDEDENEAESMGPPHLAPTTPPPMFPRSLNRFSSSESGPDTMGGVAGSSRHGSGSPGFPQPGTSSHPNSVGNRSRSSSIVGARGNGTGSGVIRRAVNRRGNLMPKDRGVLRVAATLQDEKKPEDSEIASEAKLQKKLGGDPSLPRTPRLGGTSGGKMRSPFHGARGFASAAAGGASGFASVARSSARFRWDDDDDYDSLEMDGLGNDDHNSSSSEEDLAAAQAQIASMESEEETEMQDETRDPKAAAPGAESPLEGASSSLLKNRRGSLWMGFRESRPYHHRASPGSERLLRARTPGHVLPVEMETSPKGPVMGVTSPWARSSKRKMMSGEDRYEPYANSVHKRRAVSPMTLLTAGSLTGGVGSAGTGAGAGTSMTSPSLLAAQQFQQLQRDQQQQTLAMQGGSTSGSAVAMPTPISMPSPTHTISMSASPAAPFGAYFSGNHYKPSQLGSGATTPGSSATAAVSTSRSSRSRAASPALVSRPPTPVSRAVTASGILHSYTSAALSASGGNGGVGAGQSLGSPSFLSTSLGSVVASGSGGGGSGSLNAAASRNSGSGPGYGSGALGLSIGGNSASMSGSNNGGGGGVAGLLSTSSSNMAGLFGSSLGGGTTSSGGTLPASSSGGGWLSGIGVEPGGYKDDDKLEGEEMDEGVRMLGLG